jgi:hypothetical protein
MTTAAGLEHPVFVTLKRSSHSKKYLPQWMTEEDAQPGTKVRALQDYCATFDCPFGAIGTILGRSDVDDRQQLTIQWELPGEGRAIIGDVSISNGDLAGLYVVGEG